MFVKKNAALVAKLLGVGALLTVIGLSTFARPLIREAPKSNVLLLSGEGRDLADPKEKLVVVFWATWCPPCKVELARLNRMVEEKPELATRIVAVSVGEKPALVRAEAEKRGYRFTVATDEFSEAAEKYKIVGTPTVLLKDKNNVVTWMTSGLSPTLELRVSNHFAD